MTAGRCDRWSTGTAAGGSGDVSDGRVISKGGDVFDATDGLTGGGSLRTDDTISA